MAGVAASTDTFRAVADPTRRAMLDMLLDADRTVSELAEPFRMTQPAISQHLRILRDAGLVRRRHAGRQSFYRANSRPIGKVFDWAKRYQLTDPFGHGWVAKTLRSEEHTSELQSLTNLVCRLLLDKKKTRLHAHLRVRID